MDGRRVLLLDDRGLSESGPPNIWTVTSVEDIVDMARVVVEPDEPFKGCSHEDMAADHWAQLSEILRGRELALLDVWLRPTSALSFDPELTAAGAAPGG